MAFHNVPPNGFPDIPDIEDLEAVEKDVKTLKTTTSEQGAAITALGTNKAPKTDISAAFSAESNYEVGDLVYYEGALYECTTAHEAAAWSAEDFTAASVGSTISGVNSNISTLESGLTNLGKHEVLTIAANTYTSWEDALTALYTAYMALTADQKRIAYLIMDDSYVAYNSAINYGNFSRSLLVSSGGTFGIRTDMYALANKVAIQAALYNGEAADIVNITANAQTNKVALYY